MIQIYNNTNTFRIFLFLIFIFGKCGIGLFAQTSLIGKITDAESGEELIGANVIVKKNGNFIQGETTDIDGNFSIRIDPGMYDMEISYTGYPTRKIEGVLASAGVATKINVAIKVGLGQIVGLGGCGPCWLIPLIMQDETTIEKKITSDQIRNLPTRNINNISTIAPGVSFTQ